MYSAFTEIMNKCGVAESGVLLRHDWPHPKLSNLVPAIEARCSMVAYVVVTVDIHDPVGFEEYQRLGPPVLAKFGGRVLVRNDNAEVLEGSWQPRRLIILEFDDVAAARAWHGSQEYAEAKLVRQRTAETHSVVLESLAT
jgi:uncharacterized protein (DUF1330 family)